MLYLSGLIFALCIVAGQALYKAAVDKVGFELSFGFIFSKRLLELIFSWEFLLGVTLFLLATGVNFWMYTKFQFSAIQVIVVPLVLVFSFVAGAWFFKDHITILNMAGFFVIVAGVVLATLR